MDNTTLVEVLNNIVQINNDRVAGYKTAAEETKDVELQNLFAQLLQTSKQNITALESGIQLHGGTPTDSTRLSGKVFRVWMDVKAALTGADHIKILESCIYGELQATDTYEKVLDEYKDTMPDKYITILKMQHQALKADYNKVNERLLKFQELEKKD